MARDIRDMVAVVDVVLVPPLTGVVYPTGHPARHAPVVGLQVIVGTTDAVTSQVLAMVVVGALGPSPPAPPPLGLSCFWRPRPDAIPTLETILLAAAPPVAAHDEAATVMVLATIGPRPDPQGPPPVTRQPPDVPPRTVVTRVPSTPLQVVEVHARPVAFPVTPHIADMVGVRLPHPIGSAPRLHVALAYGETPSPSVPFPQVAGLATPVVARAAFHLALLLDVTPAVAATQGLRRRTVPSRPDEVVDRVRRVFLGLSHNSSFPGEAVSETVTLRYCLSQEKTFPLHT